MPLGPLSPLSPLSNEGAVPATRCPGERHHAYSGNGRHTRQRFDSWKKALEHRSDSFAAREFLVREAELDDRNVVHGQPGVDGVERLKGPTEESCNEEDKDRQTHLKHHHRPLREHRTSRRRRVPAASLQQRDIARRPDCRHDGGTKCGREANESSQSERNTLETDFLESRNVGGREGDQHSNDFSRHHGADQAAEKCERKAFDEKEPDDSSAARAKCLTDGNLLLTRGA